MQELKENTLSLEHAIPSSWPTTVSNNTMRMSSLDIQRGIIMMIMAFAHSREYIGSDAYSNNTAGDSPNWLGNSWLDALQQVVVPLVAGGFFMMMGIGIYFMWQARLKEGWQPKKIAHFLFVRGGLMILLQLTILQLFEYISSGKYYFYAGVLMTLGWCMIGAACCMWFIDTVQQKSWAKDKRMDVVIPIILIITLVLGTQWCVYFIDYQHVTLWQVIGLVCGHYLTSFNLEMDINYTPLPWFSAVIFGLLMGKIFYQQKQESFQKLQKLVFIMLIGWFFLRTANLQGWFSFGDYKIPATGESLGWMAYFCQSKFPPSLTYFLWVLAINLAGIILWHNIEMRSAILSRLLHPIKIFGQCALFFFICHWFIYYGISLLFAEKLTTAIGITSCWLLGLFILYPMCLSFRNFKSKQSQSSLWKMF